MNHLDAFSAPLFSSQAEPPTDREFLEEIHLITSVLCNIAGHDFSVSGVGGSSEVALHRWTIEQNKIQRLLFSILSNYILGENWIKRAGPEAYLEAQRTATNVLQTARQIILNSCYKDGNGACPRIFSANLAAESIHGNEDPPLGLIIKEHFRNSHFSIFP